MKKLNLTKSNLIKMISFYLLTVVLLGSGCLYFYRQSQTYKMVLENSYKHSLQDFNDYIDNIYNSLDKGLYINTPYQLSNISANLLSDSRAATMCLSTLPASELHLENTFKFLAQVGSYASSLNKRYHANQQISDDDYQSLASLKNYAKKLNVYVSDLESQMLKNNIDLNNFSSSVSRAKEQSEKIDFGGLEDNFVNYPKMIYDGPFSDHLYGKTPERTKGLAEISVGQAKKIAALATGISEDNLKKGEDENSNMPLYCFTSDGISIGITKKGGLVCYILKSREVKNSEIEPGVALEIAKKYISEILKISDVEQSYYEINNHCCTVNFICCEDEIAIYPDLIKISVALDNGQILCVDTRKYINNHKERKFSDPKKTVTEAQNVLSKNLDVLKEPRKAIIPTDGENEVMTYEFICRTKDQRTILVYINADTLEEEQILILSESENGILTV